MDFEEAEEHTDDDFNNEDVNDFLYGQEDSVEDPVIQDEIEEPFEDAVLQEEIEASALNEEDENIDESFMENQIISNIENADKTANFNPDATGIGDIFSQMEQDARQAVEGNANENVDPLAPAVVDSKGNLISTSPASNLTAKPEAILPPKKKKLGNYKISTDLLTEYDENEYWIID